AGLFIMVEGAVRLADVVANLAGSPVQVGEIARMKPAAVLDQALDVRELGRCGFKGPDRGEPVVGGRQFLAEGNCAPETVFGSVEAAERQVKLTLSNQGGAILRVELQGLVVGLLGQDRAMLQAADVAEVGAAFGIPSIKG